MSRESVTSPSPSPPPPSSSSSQIKHHRLESDCGKTLLILSGALLIDRQSVFMVITACKNTCIFLAAINCGRLGWSLGVINSLMKAAAGGGLCSVWINNANFYPTGEKDDFLWSSACCHNSFSLCLSSSTQWEALIASWKLLDWLRLTFQATGC